MENKLYRSRTDRMIFGVCGGLGKYLGIDSTIMRILFVLLAFAGGAGIIAYIVMAIIVPLEESKKTTPQGVVEENVQDIKETATRLGTEIRDTFAAPGKTSSETKTDDIIQIQARRRNALGIIIIFIGVVCLLGALNIFHGFNWWGVIVSLILLAVGILMIIGLRRKP